MKSCVSEDPDALFSYWKEIMDIQQLRKKATALPQKPGVYIMKDTGGNIIYIGKAKVLCNRVSQYFGSQNNHTRKVRKMVEHVDDFDYIVVNSEFEALVLECNLIKRHQPKYNILLKDDKGYSYVRVTRGEWKKISAVKQKADDGAIYYGPFTSSENSSAAVRQALDVFMLAHCGRVFPRDINKNSRPCLNYHIKLCSAPCCGMISQHDYDANAEAAVKFILGGKSDYLKQLYLDMNKASEALEFEKAAKIRDRIRAVERVAQKQHVVSVKTDEQDVFGVASTGNKSAVCVLSFRGGSLTDTKTFVTDRLDDLGAEYAELLCSYYSEVNDIPSQICVDSDFDELADTEQFLSGLKSKRVKIIRPLAGENAGVVEMARNNAMQKLSRLVTSDDRSRAVLLELQELLGLKHYPQYIESYDISNTAGHENVAGMIVYKDGRPFRKSYRRFMIKSFEGQDDFRSLAEVINRRINEYFTNEGEAEGFGVKPDLILLDGGLGQVSAVREVLRQRNFDVPLFGMVKDGKHRTRAIASDGGEVAIKDNRSVFSFVSEIQEEVHRYAISYHRERRKKSALESVLFKIDGIGKTRAKALMQRFKTVSAISQADFNELISVPGMTAPAAENVLKYFEKENIQ